MQLSYYLQVTVENFVNQNINEISSLMIQAVNTIFYSDRHIYIDFLHKV